MPNNIIITRGHSAFRVDVERGLNMADRALPLTCTFEGTMPQRECLLPSVLAVCKKLIAIINNDDAFKSVVIIYNYPI